MNPVRRSFCLFRQTDDKRVLLNENDPFLPPPLFDAFAFEAIAIFCKFEECKKCVWVCGWLPPKNFSNIFALNDRQYLHLELNYVRLHAEPFESSFCTRSIILASLSADLKLLFSVVALMALASTFVPLKLMFIILLSYKMYDTAQGLTQQIN